ncbi:hypothetical protein CLG96_01930 [Sphingomonas oleivorans]|uniref:Uncharacterized protein n=1 Tax=Sphingomonas oleivorans TaxID=1735121 RepID=A0A2T5G199_9SPHN|nr:hypothetical protein [Sphingomonas oleivorans]PTQ12925.1 hypothetical protein CLG96_01930 [Sphingomonas oleivorans]
MTDEALPITIVFSAGYLDGVMEGEPAEVRRQWRTIRQHVRSQAARIAELERERDTAFSDAALYAKALFKMRDMLIAVNDELEDEGDRVYLGSTNHADLIRDAWNFADNLQWEEIIEKNRPRTSYREALDCQIARANAAEARVAELERERDELLGAKNFPDPSRLSGYCRRAPAAEAERDRLREALRPSPTQPGSGEDA